MTLSFRTRLTLRWVGAFGLVLALANVTVYLGTRAFLQRDLDAQLRTLAGTELASSSDEPDGLHLHPFTVDPRRPQDYADKFVQLIDDRGQILMQSPGLGVRRSLVEGEYLVTSFAGRAPLFDVSVNGRPGRMTALATASQPRYLVAVGLFTDGLEATLERLRALLIGVWFGALLVTAVIGFTLASRALVPIRRVTRQAAAIAGGQFDTRLDEPALNDEIGQMTRLLNEMLDRLRGALDANRRFAADASHELRSPLTALLGEIDVTLKRDRTPSEYREALTTLHARLKSMHGLTEDLMVLVRAQEHQPSPVAEVPVHDLLQRVCAGAAAAADAARVSIIADVPQDLVVYGDGRLLERVFDNLVRNAIQYNRDHGTVRITAHMRPSSQQWASDQVVIAVRDSGSGIPEDERERIFERFYRVDPSRSRRTGGTGLGLAIAREIVQLFKGIIRVAESDASGTTIEVQLPGGASA